MAEDSFQIRYEGDALTDNRMDVRDLAPALLSLSELMAEANRLVNPSQPPVSQAISATAPGSFAVDLVIVQEGLKQIVDLFTSDAANALSNLKDLVLAPGLGVFGFWQWKGKRRIANEQRKGGSVTLTLDDGDSTTVPIDALRLFRNASIRRHIKEVLAPLERDGIERVVLRDVTQEVILSQADLATFDEAEERQLVSANSMPMTLEVTSPSFAEGNKWRLSDGASIFWASVSDDNFLEQVRKHEVTFGRGDLLDCLVEFQQYRTETGGLSLDRNIVTVNRLIPASIPDALEE